MKTFVYISAFLLTIYSCKGHDYYGKKISIENAINFSDASKKAFANGSVKATISGTIIETCAKKGCWMRLNTKTDTLLVKSTSEAHCWNKVKFISPSRPEDIISKSSKFSNWSPFKSPFVDMI